MNLEQKRDRSVGVFLKCSTFRKLDFIQAKQKWWAEGKDNKQKQEPMMNELVLPKPIYPQTVTATLRDTSRYPSQLAQQYNSHCWDKAAELNTSLPHTKVASLNPA
jgi:hypothetical protein